ncbi:MAG: GAF domain-containing protein [Rhodocyclaceae bacterium]|jgi:adenylate cyclase|nr:GAF domain-containing protein [Rhodocyclaceae bacterium]
MSRLFSVDAIRNCLEGIVPASLSTCGPDGMPNVTYVSQLMYVDPDHVALSFQFFNKTRENILANPHATALVVDHLTVERFRLRLRYLRTETSGPLFERMKAKLAGIAAHEGMTGVFKLQGADVYRVRDIEPVPGRQLPPAQEGPALLPALRRATDALSACRSLESLLDTLASSLERHFDLAHQMLFMADETAGKLYLMGSRGYATSGVGAEIPCGVGVIGIAARERVPIRIMFPAADYGYGRAIREHALAQGITEHLETAIPPPGLGNPASQLAIPVLGCQGLQAVLYVESERECHFGYDLEDALVALCAQFGLALQTHRAHQEAEEDATPAPGAGTCPPPGPPLKVRHFSRNHSIFLGDDYLIKGVAGAILWVLLQDATREHRSEFSNRALRLDPRLNLPEIDDNLEARLLLLQRRLADRAAPLSIEKTGRGRFGLRLAQPVELVEEAER